MSLHPSALPISCPHGTTTCGRPADPRCPHLCPHHGWNQGKLDIVDEISTPDLIAHSAAQPDQHGIAEIKRYVTDVRTPFPVIHFTINELNAQGDTVVASTTFTGT